MKQPNPTDTSARPSTDCRQASFQFQDLGGRAVVADFSGGYLSSDGGALLLRQVDRSVGLSRALAGCFVDQRDARFVEHGVSELVAQRLYALALGYEDLNDHADLRRDPLLATDPTGSGRVLLVFRAWEGNADAVGWAVARRLRIEYPGALHHVICYRFH